MPHIISLRDAMDSNFAHNTAHVSTIRTSNYGKPLANDLRFDSSSGRSINSNGHLTASLPGIWPADALNLASVNRIPLTRQHEGRSYDSSDG